MKYALVTGCDHGLGLSLASQLLGRGYRVAACRLNREETQIDALAKEHPDQLSVFSVDIGRDGDVRALCEAVGRTFPCLDLVINCAGILGVMDPGPDGELDYDLMLRVFNVNALGTLRVSTGLLPLLRRGRDKTVVNISSEAGSIADCWRTGWFGYCMSKAANNMQGALLHNTLRQEGGQVIQIHPGHVATYMRGHLDETAALTPEASARNVLSAVLDTPRPVRERPWFLDHLGREMPW